MVYLIPNRRGKTIMLNVIKTGDPQAKPSVVMLVYGEGGVGKTTFASTAVNPILADCEGGSKYFGLRGINTSVANITKWSDMKEFLTIVEDYDTIVIDPIGELMEMLKNYMISLNDTKLVQKDGSPTMAGWGFLKKTMRTYIKVLRNTGKHIIIVAHVDEKQDEQRIIKRPKVETKLSDELVALVDIVAYMTNVRDGEESKRALLVDASSDQFVAKDRTGQLGKVVEPNFAKIVRAIQGTETYKWSSPTAKKTVDEAEKEVKKEEEPKKEKPKQTEETMANGVNYVEKLREVLLTEAKKRGKILPDGKEKTPAQLDEICIELFREYTGSKAKSIKVKPSTASVYLTNFYNSPKMAGGRQ